MISLEFFNRLLFTICFIHFYKAFQESPLIKGAVVKKKRLGILLKENQGLSVSANTLTNSLIKGCFQRIYFEAVKHN